MIVTLGQLPGHDGVMVLLCVFIDVESKFACGCW